MEPESQPDPVVVRTLIHDYDKGHGIAYVNGAVWPPIGSAIELSMPNRDVVVLAVRLAVQHDHTANIIVDVRDAHPGEFIARHPLDQPRDF